MGEGPRSGVVPRSSRVYCWATLAPGSVRASIASVPVLAAMVCPVSFFPPSPGSTVALASSVPAALVLGRGMQALVACKLHEKRLQVAVEAHDHQ